MSTYRTNFLNPFLVLLMALALNACQRTPEVTINEVSYVAGDYTFEGPDTIPSGWTRISLQNEGQEMHHGQLMRLPEGRSMDDLFAALQENPNHPPQWLSYAGGPSVFIPGESGSALVNLEPGNYVLICVLPDSAGVPHAAHGMVMPIVVSGESVAADAPPVEADITMELSDFAFALSEDVTAGEHTFRVVNNGEQPHEVAVVQLAPGATVEEFLAAVEPGAGSGPPPGKPIGGLQVIDPGNNGYFSADFQPGNYVLLCFHPDPASGAPHLALGMMQQITIDG